MPLDSNNAKFTAPRHTATVGNIDNPVFTPKPTV